MTNQSTINKLIEMRLTAMSDAFRNQLNDAKMADVPFEDRFGMIVDIEYTSRKNNRLKRLIKNASFDQSDARIMDKITHLGEDSTNSSLLDWQHVNTSPSTETSLSLGQPGVAKRTWHVPLVWRPASSTSPPSM